MSDPELFTYLQGKFAARVNDLYDDIEILGAKTGWPLKNGAGLEFGALLAWRALGLITRLPPNDASKVLQFAPFYSFVSDAAFQGNSALGQDVLVSRFALYNAVTRHFADVPDEDIWSNLTEWLDTQLQIQPPTKMFEARLSRAAFGHREIMERVPDGIARLGPAPDFPAIHAPMIGQKANVSREDQKRYDEYFTELVACVIHRGYSLGPLWRHYYEAGNLNALSERQLEEIEIDALAEAAHGIAAWFRE